MTVSATSGGRAAPDLRRGVVRRRLRVTGVVQGVGYRPFVHRIATELGLAGHVGNDGEGVFAEVEGDPSAVDRFESRLEGEAPPLARVHRVDSVPVAPQGDAGFRIVESEAGSGSKTYVSPDVAVCADCLREMFDPFGRRYRYPFINCTNCGPRFTITIRLPYDRPNTTMRGFDMCAACRSEYDDPSNRRFHAQPIACADCGPGLWFEGSDGPVETGDAAVASAQKALALGLTVAVKGLGGFHLACDAASDQAVGELRRRKARPDKPFAIMVRDVDAARRLAHVDDAEASLLTGAQRPIVLLRRRDPGVPGSLVAPHNPYLGVMLPYTPVHHLLFEAVVESGVHAPEVLVMTSGNLSEEPICYDDSDARTRLAGLADRWLMHDRPIHVPCDDSVVRVESGAELPVRRSRGYTPLPVRLPFAVEPVLASGGELKNTFCLASGEDAWVSQHIGDMGSIETLAAFERSVRQFGEMYRVEASMVAADAHPGYQTRRWAEDQPDRLVELVQHHHAHVAAVMVEHGVVPPQRVIGVAFDGTGYGSDGAIWGGEVLVASYERFERAAHLRYVPLPGGDATVKRPYRAALAYLRASGIDWAADLRPVQVASPEELTVLDRQLERGTQCVPTSSMGRLFDAVSSLLGVRHTVSYEAQAAIELEAVAAPNVSTARRYRFGIAGDEPQELDATSLLQAIVDDLRRGVPRGRIAAGFHLAVAEVVGEVAAGLRRTTGLRRVVLSGGVFQNVLLLELVRDKLVELGMYPLTHRILPPNDGGLSLGQVAVAARRVATGERGRVL